MINYCSGYCYCLNILPTSWFSVVRSLIIHPPSFYSGASLQGTSWGRVLCPLYSGASLQVTSWGRVLCPLYSGASLQVTSWGRVLCPLYSGASLQGTSWGTGPLSLIQWSLSTRDKLGDGSFVPYTVEPLYKGQVGDGSYTVEPLYKGTGPLSLIQWSLSTRDRSFIPCGEVVIFPPPTHSHNS